MLEFFRSVDAQEAGAIGLGDDTGARVREDHVPISVVAVVVRVEHIADRLVGRFLDRLDDVVGFLGEVGVDDHDVVLEYDPDVVAAAEGNVGALRADRRIAEEDARRDFLDVVEPHLRHFVGGPCATA